MALADRIVEHPADEVCSLGALLNSLDGAELAALQVMLGTPEQWGWTAPRVYEAVHAEGYVVGFKTINKHRASPQTCRCAKAAS